jgi:hypothetical protein
MSIAVDNLLDLPQGKLDDLFRGSPPGEIPQGDARGTVVFAPGSKLAEPAARLARLVAWQGKVFDPDRGELLNKITPFGIRSIRAKVYKDSSWLDGNESIVLDYSRASLVAHWVRDEIRSIGPGTYLGIVYLGRARVLKFVLEFPVC